MPKPTPKPSLQTALIFFSVLLTAAFLMVVASRPPLTGGEVLRNARQLETLAAWTSLDLADPAATGQITYTFGSRCGQIRGLASIAQWDRTGQPTRPETHLWFSLGRDETRWFRNPSRKPLASAVALRNELNSDLATRQSPDRLSITIEPDQESPLLGGLLQLDNLQGAAAITTSRTSNRKLNAVVRPVHCHFTEKDVELLGLLAKVLRGRMCAGDEPCDPVALTLFRSPKGGEYRIDLRALGKARGVFPITLKVTRWHEGPRAATLRARWDEITLDRAASLFVAAPRPRGAMLSPQDPGVLELRYEPGRPEASSLAGRIDFDLLLGTTAWQSYDQ